MAEECRGGTLRNRIRGSARPNAVASAEQIHPKSGTPDDGIARLLHQSADALPVDADQAASPFAHLAGDEDGLDMAGVHEIHHGSRRIVERPDVESIGLEHHDVGILAGAERPDLAVEVGAASALDGGELEDLPTR